MNLIHLKYFMEVAENLSISKAANSLFISQPALSRTIKSFEESLGVKLFTRNNKGLILTPAGKILQEEAVNFFSNERRLMERLHNATEKNSIPLKILYAPDTFSDKLNRFNLFYNQHYCSQKFIIERSTWAEIRSDFRHGLADMAICLELVFKDVTGIRTLPICESCNCVILPKDHPLSKKDQLSLKDISTMTYVSRNPAGTGDVLQLKTTLNNAGYEMVPTIEHNNTDSVMVAVALGQGFSVIAQTLFSEKYQDVLCAIPCPELGKERFVIAWPKSIESENLLTIIDRMAAYKWF